MDLRLSGRRALVTGASKGIGFASAKLLAQEGCDVVLVSRSKPDLERAKAKIEDAAPKARIEIASHDLSKDEAVPALVERYGERTDILVNNAGAIPGGTLADIDQPRWREAWELKLFGYIGMTRAFHARMAARRSGVIVNVIGAAGERVSASYIAGSTANAGLMAFTRALGAASPAHGVRVVGINPGPVSTDGSKPCSEAGRRAFWVIPSAGARCSRTCPSAAPRPLRKSPPWWPSSPPTSRPTRPAPSSRSMGA